MVLHVHTLPCTSGSHKQYRSIVLDHNVHKVSEPTQRGRGSSLWSECVTRVGSPDSVHCGYDDVTQFLDGWINTSVLDSIQPQGPLASALKQIVIHSPLTHSILPILSGIGPPEGTVYYLFDTNKKLSDSHNGHCQVTLLPQ